MAVRVFIVDDEKVLADTLKAILRNSGYEASAFYNAQSALKQIMAFPPELVISDVMMPGMSGVEMALLISEHCPECRILLFSGQASTADLLEAARTQGYNFDLLTKPIHPTELLAQIATMSGARPA